MMSDVAEKLKKWTGERRMAELITHHYGVKVKEAKPIRGIVRMDTDQGTFVLKRVRFGEESRWKLVEKMARHLSETGDHRIPHPVRTNGGGTTFAGMQNRYVLLPWIEARERDLKQTRAWPHVARAMARMHTASRGFSPSGILRSHLHYDKWTKIWEQLSRQVQMFKVAAELSGKVRSVDRTWLSHGSYVEGLLETSRKYLDKLGGDRTVEETRKGGELCHCNIHRRNLLWDDRGNLHFIDWNRAALDVRSRDLARFVLYAYGRTGSMDTVAAVLKAYQEISPLEEADYALMYAQLLFPHRLVRVLQQIYHEQKTELPASEETLIASVRGEEQKSDMLREFPKLLKMHFRVDIPRVDWL